MSFEAPQAFVFLLAVVGASLLFRFAFAWRKRALSLLARSSSPALLEHVGAHRRQATKAVLALAALAALVIAIARPHVGDAPPPAVPTAGDLVVVLDVSQSMAAEDVAPSRLAAAKSQVAALLERLQGERVGLVVFAGSAALRFPLTRDYGAAGTLTRAVEIDSAPAPGSAYGEGIQSAVRALRQSDTKQRALFVIGDGESFNEDLANTAQEASAEEIPVYAVGMGTTEGAEIPVPATAGGGPSVKRDASGQVVITRLQEDGLRILADMTGGGYQRASPGGRELQQLYEGAGQRFAAGANESNPLDVSDLTPYFVLVTFLALLIDWLVPERRRPAPTQRSSGAGSARAAGGKIPAAASLATLTLLLTGCTGIASVVAFEMNEEGSQLFFQGRFHEALDRFRRAQVDQPALPEPDFNVGATLYKIRELERSIRETQPALNAESAALRAAAHFNMGNAYFQLERYQDAFEAYKKALREDPEDQDAKVNLELALHRLRQQQQQQQQQGQQPQPGEGNPQPNPGPEPQPGQGEPQPGNGAAGPSRPADPTTDAAERLRRELRAAGPDMTIEDALRVLEALREREAAFQRRYNEAPREQRPSQRPAQDW